MASAALPRLEVDTFPFELSHGRSPRGRGSWAFCPFHKRNSGDYLEFTLFSPSMTYGEAKRWLREKVAELRSTAPLGSPYLADVWAAMP